MFFSEEYYIRMDILEKNKSERETRFARFARWGKYAGIVAFLFFFIKGLVWLAIAGLVIWGAGYG